VIVAEHSRQPPTEAILAESGARASDRVIEPAESRRGSNKW
jgi:hypothetical protein